MVDIANEAPRSPLGFAPLRRPLSIRRTSTIDTIWPDGLEGLRLMEGRARDVFTGPDVDHVATVREDRFTARLDSDRVIHEIASQPPRARLGELVGARGGGHLRGVLDNAVHDERVAATPLYLLLDDISGASLVAAWAWIHWIDDWESLRRRFESEAKDSRRLRMENICIGFATGSSALSGDGMPMPSQHSMPVAPLVNPGDPRGWHELLEVKEISMRRARRIDVWLDGLIHVDAWFQDSATTPNGGRVAIHEYSLAASAEPGTNTLLSLEATPRILPYRECPNAVKNIQPLLGTPLVELRQKVIETLPGNLGCTHLNDALRSLADAAALVPSLQQQLQR